MEGAGLASYIVLWMLVVALAMLVVSHSRLLGLLYQRIGPGIARAVAEGPAVGVRVEEIQATTLFGLPWSRRFPTQDESIVVFVSPQCSACTELIPHIRDFIAHFGSRTGLVLLSVLGDPAMNRAFADYARIGDLPYVVAEDFAAKLQIAGTPYGFKLDRNGVILAKGIVNHFEHLVSLWNVTETTVPGPGGRVNTVSEDVIA